MTTREALIEFAQRRNDPTMAEYLRAKSDEEVDESIAAFVDWGKRLSAAALEMHAAAARALGPLAALAEKYRDVA